MSRIAPLLLLSLAGCLYQPDRAPTPEPEPPAPASAVAAAADKGMVDYRSRAADACAAMRGRLTEFKTWADFAAAWEKENQSARVKSFGDYAEAINAELFARNPDGTWKTDGPFDSEKAERVLTDAEAGFRGK